MPEIMTDAASNLSPELQRAYQIATKAERKSVEHVESRKKIIDEKIDNLSDVLTKIDSVQRMLPQLNTPIAFRELGVFSSNENLITGTADKQIAEPGSHNIEILNLASRATAMSNAFEDKDETRIGTGYVSFLTSRGDTKEIFIDNENATLEGVANIINRSKVGLKASVFYNPNDEDAPYRLLLTSDGTGVFNDVDYPEFYFVDGEEDFFIENVKEASNARFRYEGLDMESPTNEMKDLIPGMSVNFKGVTGHGVPATLTVGQDIPRTKMKVMDFVNGINEVFSFIQNQNKFDPNAPSKPLSGDYGIRTTESRIRSALSQNFLLDSDRTIRSATDLGISFNKHGTLDFDEKKFENALNSNFDEVLDLLTGDGVTYGIFPSLAKTLTSISDSQQGVLGAQRQNYKARAKEAQSDIEQKQKFAERKGELLREKLAKAEQALQTMKTQGNFFGAQNSSIPGLGG